MTRRFVSSVLALFCLLPSFVHADVIYDVDFEDPPHVLGNPVTFGSGSDIPSTAVDAVVAENVADFSTQVALVDNEGVVAFAPNTVGNEFTSGVFLFSWDYAMVEFEGNAFQSSVNISSGQESIGFFLDYYEVASGTLNTNVIIYQNVEIATFDLNEQDHFDLLVDLDNDYLNLSMNGTPLLTGEPIPADGDIFSFRFATPTFASPKFALDNFVWQQIPEPSTFLLVALAGLLLASKASKVRKNAP